MSAKFQPRARRRGSMMSALVFASLLAPLDFSFCAEANTATIVSARAISPRYRSGVHRLLAALRFGRVPWGRSVLRICPRMERTPGSQDGISRRDSRGTADRSQHETVDSPSRSIRPHLVLGGTPDGPFRPFHLNPHDGVQ